MSFRVVWMPPAEDRLAAVWLAAPDRNAVTRAAQYEVDDAGRVVYVLNVWSTAGGRPPLTGG